MKAGTDFRREPSQVKLLHVDARAGRLHDAPFTALPELLGRGDLLVLNDAATLPASLRAGALEVRLAGELEGGAWRAVLFGEGDWRTDTDLRPPPPRVPAGAHLRFGEGLSATVESVSTVSPRLVSLRFDETGAALWSALYRHGRPVQYAYLDAPLPLEAVQTGYAARPWASEMPSAGRALRWPVLARLSERGVAVATLTHAAGLSATGDPALDAALPLPERYELPQATVQAVQRANRVIAVGTTVVRALEGNAKSHGGALEAGRAQTDLVIGPGTSLSVVDGILSGMHQPGTSHFSLLGAFAKPQLLDRAASHAEAAGYLIHELGDSTLIL
ncbi:MAG: S-adenosylmethionine:tRNA ribosyltransferase-isomerase [Archangiaceae bacterium]|nr:S-adenosylmethionine:tRNA ribosyltransferase-isomerase [Archangiaceae bacterium]